MPTYDIVSLNTINSELNKITIPGYQRPYCWSSDSINTLFNDTYSAYEDGKKEYRLGTVILFHERDSSEYHIVDGQQRLTTLAILLFCLDENYKSCILNTEYKKPSKSNIELCYAILRGRTRELRRKKSDVGAVSAVDKYKEYLLENCKIVKIVTSDEQEAFQFFDSQNSRGLALAPHDLLKSYHLREMRHMNAEDKARVIEKWEKLIEQGNLESLFADYLYPLMNWYRDRSGLGYSTKKIGAFKGFTEKDTSNSAVYHKASNLFVEQFNQSGKLLLGDQDNETDLQNKDNQQDNVHQQLNQFQLTQPIIDGIRFFNFTFHYQDLLYRVRKEIVDNKNKYSEQEVPASRTGDRYVKQLFECVLLFIADKFGFEAITPEVEQLIYTWCYTLRLKMYAVYPETIEKYVMGEHGGRTGVKIPIFAKLNELKDVENELNLVINYSSVPTIEKEAEDSRVLGRYEDVLKRLNRRNE